MSWIWQKEKWPKFEYNDSMLKEFEAQFLQCAGRLDGASKYLSQPDREIMSIDLMCDEALKTSSIEGEILNRDSVRNSLIRHFLKIKQNRKVLPGEEGVAKMMVDLYQMATEPLTEKTLFSWHTMIMAGRWDLDSVGYYRKHSEPMQIVSGYINKFKVHYEAPPSEQVPQEMKLFIQWFTDSAPGGSSPLQPLERAALAHLYFIIIHPFEDGNGRIGRGIAIKSLSQSLSHPILLTLSSVINQHKINYYDEIAKTNKSLDVNDWMLYFSKTILEACDYSQRLIDFVVIKSRFFDNYKGKLNERQEKVIARIFEEGLSGFKGGLSAKNYIKIADTSPSTATRDLHELIDMDIFISRGKYKSTRYYLICINDLINANT